MKRMQNDHITFRMWETEQVSLPTSPNHECSSKTCSASRHFLSQPSSRLSSLFLGWIWREARGGKAVSAHINLLQRLWLQVKLKAFSCLFWVDYFFWIKTAMHTLLLNVLKVDFCYIIARQSKHGILDAYMMDAEYIQRQTNTRSMQNRRTVGQSQGKYFCVDSRLMTIVVPTHCSGIWCAKTPLHLFSL